MPGDVEPELVHHLHGAGVHALSFVLALKMRTPGGMIARAMPSAIWLRHAYPCRETARPWSPDTSRRRQGIWAMRSLENLTATSKAR
ncbi:MAG: hypothetical protein IPJ88_00015 [Myxococcales bacterium]|nr:MAG: hypothetical protein IPJ88_00015 [Myxococcales bacterium]